MLVISPYARAGYITHKQYEFGTIVKFVEDNWDLPRLGNTDVRAASMIDDVFNFKQAPRPFHEIPAAYSRQYFMHQKPSAQNHRRRRLSSSLEIVYARTGVRPERVVLR